MHHLSSSMFYIWFVFISYFLPGCFLDILYATLGYIFHPTLTGDGDDTHTNQQQIYMYIESCMVRKICLFHFFFLFSLWMEFTNEKVLWFFFPFYFHFLSSLRHMVSFLVWWDVELAGDMTIYHAVSSPPTRIYISLFSFFFFFIYSEKPLVI